MGDLEDLVEELKSQHTYTIYKRSLPAGINKVIAQNLLSYEDALKFCKTMKLKVHEVYEDNVRTVIYYDILPDSDEYKNPYFNDCKITTGGNDKKKACIKYMGLD